MMTKNKLELNWVDKEKRPRLEPRILLEEPSKSFHAKQRVSKNDIFDNHLIFGDNLLALKALEQEYSGQIKCIFIDPPYNTGSAFAHYDDGVQHSIWLSLIRDRLDIIYRLLSSDGSLWITIDDNEVHYLKVVCDEIFGRNNFIANVVWQKKYTVSNDAKWFSDNHDHILIYAKNKDTWKPNKLPRSDEMNARYSNPDNHPKGPWKSTPLHAKSGSEKSKSFSYTFKNGYYWTPPAGTFPRFSEESLKKYDQGNEIWFGRDGKSQPSRKTFLSELSSDGIPPLTIWLNDEVGHNHEAKSEVKAFNPSDVFSTPKPERLIQRIIHLSTNSGDIVLDSFAGSGTTGAVAHKMGRRWIMVELGEHCNTHIIPRLQKVIDGEDEGGISQSVNWKGGGGFRYYSLAPSLLQQDKWGQWVINKAYNPEMLAQALCKLEGFTYAPSDVHYWQHGYSTESDFIYVTTASLNHEQLQQLNDDVGSESSLLVLCTSFRGNGNYPNLTVKKIPKHVLSRCEWGHDDYSRNVENLPNAPVAPPEAYASANPKRNDSSNSAQTALFDEGEE